MTFRTKPQYLLPVPKAQSWDLPLVFKRIYKIDYDITIKHLETYPLLESLDRSIKPVVIITIYGGWLRFPALSHHSGAVPALRSFRLLPSSVAPLAPLSSPQPTGASLRVSLIDN